MEIFTALSLIFACVICIKKKSVQQYIGGESQHKLLFVTDAENNPKFEHEISEPALFRFLLNEESIEQLQEAQADMPEMLNVLSGIDKQSKITLFGTYHSSMGSVEDGVKAFHVFIVFQTASKRDGVYWWSLEKSVDFIVLQRSRNEDDVKTKYAGGEREKVKAIAENLKGKGSIRDLFAILWANQVIPENYHIVNSNCQSFVTLVSKKITEEEYEYKGYFKYSIRENDRNVETLNLINVVTGITTWHPVFSFIYLENTKLLDSVIESGTYDINATQNGTTLLNLAIIFSKSKMVRHLLDKWNADPSKRSQIGFNPLHTAAIVRYKNMDIIDLLLAQKTVKIDQRSDDKLGMTALYLAILVSNTNAVQHLIDRGANLDILDNRGESPLHFAAMVTVDTKIIDLLLAAMKKVKGVDNVDELNEEGNTALHHASVASNETTAEYLIKKGADIHYRAKSGETPLHFAALHAENMKIIDLLLANIKEEDIEQYKNDENLFNYAEVNENGLGKEIIDRLGGKGIVKMKKPKISVSYEAIKDINAETGEITLRFIEKGDDPTLIYFTQIDGHRIAEAQNSQEMDRILKEGKFGINDRDKDGKTPLYYATRAENLNSVSYLLEKGADPTIRDKDRFASFDMAAILNKETKVLELLLAHEKVDFDKSDEFGRTILHMSVMGSNVTTARFLLSKGANPNVADENQITPLHKAAKFAKNPDIVELLLNQKDVEINCLDKNKQNALYYAKVNKHGLGERITNLLIEKGVGEATVETSRTSHHYERIKNVLPAESKEETSQFENLLLDESVKTGDKIETIVKGALSHAITNSDLEIDSRQIETGVDLSTLTWEKGINALHVASKYAKTTNFIDVLLETGTFDINASDNDGRTPLHYAIIGTNPTIISRHLIEKGADPNIADRKGMTPLHLAAQIGKTTDLIDLILKMKRIDINGRDTNGKTILHCAINGNNVTIARHLLDNGADPTVRDNDGITPFHLAASYSEDIDLLNLILSNEKQVDIDEKNESGMTALHMAMIKSNATAARYLIKNQANPNVADENGCTPLHLAVKHSKDMDIIELLLNEKEVDVNHSSNREQNALYFAKYNDHGLGELIANRLKEKGAVEIED
jgi:ankyrin repeat protein